MNAPDARSRWLRLLLPAALLAVGCDSANSLFKNTTPDAGEVQPDADTPTGGTGGAPVGGEPVGGTPVGGTPVGGTPVGGEPVGGAETDARVLDDTGVKDSTVEEGDIALTPDAGPTPDADPTVDAGPPADAAPAPDAAPPECLPGESAPCEDPACLGGTRTCDADGRFGACVGPAELCNFRDDDCDGRADEDYPELGLDCSAGQGACFAAGQFVCNAARNAAQCNAAPGAAGPEVCDGVDNDCDGAVDDGPDGLALSEPCYGADPATLGVGACTEGARFCENGAFTGCLGAVEPADESCNATDDDCDGFSDEGIDGAPLSEVCFDGPDGAVGVGVCAAGASACLDGIPGACAGQVLPGVEICDTFDNDCNGGTDDVPAGQSCDCEPGATRACYSGAAGTQDVGACLAGTQACTDAGVYGPCEGEVRPAAETCNGVDDDCDGELDDGVPGTGLDCLEGLGACEVAGLTVCDSAAGAVLCGAVPGAPSDETCNGVDDDCDGRADDGLGLGEVCSAGVGACAADGQRVCDALGNVVCDARQGEPTGELCNQADDDCDGNVDEGLGLGDVCSLGLGVCAAEGLVVCARDGTTYCNALPSAPGAEACNGLDDDCDGLVDDGNPGGDQACETGELGVCGIGATVCEDGGFTCVQTVQPTDETCDGLDNDCDGLEDEDGAGQPLVQACYEGAANTQGVGPCAGGTQQCDAGLFGACVGQVIPRPEICDTVDNDCNGAADDGLGNSCVCAPGTNRACYTGPADLEGVGVCRGGTQTCAADGAGYGVCEGQILPGGETCNGADDDCDGQVDDVLGIGAECGVGLGACARDGVLACNAARGVLVCDVVPGAPTPETCDGIDNDCDGVADDVEGLGDACVNGVGACAGAGNRACDQATGALVCTGVAGQPGAEVCNGVDDDCDGQTDDGIAGTGLICTAGVGGCFRQGVTVCGGAQGVVCSVSAGEAVAEVCNGVDDNCNSVVDDAPSDVGVACTAGAGACAVRGVTQCGNGVLTCSAQARQPSAEVCNQIDDDCDGQVDEGPTCLSFTSCLDALRQNWRESGIYRLRQGDVIREVYCDQVTDGGGWTLVGSTRNQTLNDQSSGWYDDLRTLAPANANAGVWNGLRLANVQAWDTRFACRQQQLGANAAMAVDLTFYGMNWYGEWTTGTDEQSCFSEADGAGADRIPPARRNNLTAGYLPANTPYNGRGDNGRPTNYLEGEDACNDTADFSVDFTDRGMDSNEQDGTDWGEDDEARKCGNQSNVDGQWFIFAREARRLAVAGSYLLGDGPNADDLPVPVSCVAACASRFGGNAADYQCSRSGEFVDRRAFVDGVDDTRFCREFNSAATDTFVRGAVYDPDGDGGSAYSAYVDDHELCALRRNFCWRWGN